MKFGKLTISCSLIFLFVFLFAFGYSKAFLLTYFFVTVHELSHVFLAKMFGCKLKEICFTPIGEIAVIDGTENLIFVQKFVIIFAGPLVNLIIWMMLNFFCQSSSFLFVANLNLILFLFNMLPIYPLDGGKLIELILERHYGIINAYRITKPINKFFLYTIIFLGIIQLILYKFNLSLLILGLYINHFNKNDEKNLALRFYKTIDAINHKTHKNYVYQTKIVTVTHEFDIKRALYMINTENFIAFIINKSKLEMITEFDIINYINNVGLDGTCEDILSFKLANFNDKENFNANT